MLILYEKGLREDSIEKWTRLNSFRFGDSRLQRFRDGDAFHDARGGMLERRCLCTSGASWAIYVSADALSLRKLAGEQILIDVCVESIGSRLSKAKS